MKKNLYIAPCVEQVELMLEACIASSTTESADVHGILPAPWGKGNEDWW